MQQSEQIDQLATAIAKAQLALQPASFDGYNPHFKSKFATLASVIDAAKIFAEHGIGFTQMTGYVGSGESVRFGVVLTLMHSSGQWKKGFYPIPEGLTSQQLGSAITYAKRYQLAAALGISADDDDDANAADVKAVEPLLSAEQVNTIYKAAAVVGVATDTICTRYGVKTISAIPASRYDAIMKKLAVAKGAAK